MKKINGGCGCNETTKNIRSNNIRDISEFEQDPLVGKKVLLVDGRKGIVNDSIRNSLGEVIGYVIEDKNREYRVFKNKIHSIIDEDEIPIDESDVMASLDSVPGMGDPHPPTRDSLGSGDQFPSIIAGTPAAKGKKKVKKEENPIHTSIMDFKTFLKNMKKTQQRK